MISQITMRDFANAAGVSSRPVSKASMSWFGHQQDDLIPDAGYRIV